ncbi:MAG: hypothetical protein ABIP17_11860 [Ilumatobacteraceae bacterium]
MTTPASSTVAVSDERLRSLRIFNLVMGLLHLCSGVAMVVLSNDFRLDVSSFALNGPPGTPLDQGTVNRLFGVPLGWATASFLLLSALFHFIIAGPGFGRYGASCATVETGSGGWSTRSRRR